MHSQNETTSSSISEQKDPSAGKDESKEEKEAEASQAKEENEPQAQSQQKVMQITKCPHVHRKHYAKVRLDGSI